MKLIMTVSAGLIDWNSLHKKVIGPLSIDVEKGLKLTLDWYLANEDRRRALQAWDGVGQRLGKVG